MKEKKTEVITFRTTPEVRKYLENKAEETDRTPAYIVKKLLQNTLKEKITNKQ